MKAKSITEIRAALADSTFKHGLRAGMLRKSLETARVEFDGDYPI